MSLLATCPDDVSIFFDFSDTFWQRVAEDAIFEKRVDKAAIGRYDGGYANGSPRPTIAPTAYHSDNTRIRRRWLNSQRMSWSATQHPLKSQHLPKRSGFFHAFWGRAIRNNYADRQGDNCGLKTVGKTGE